MEAVVAILGLFFLLCVFAGVYATVKVVKAAKRGVDRTVTQARRTVEDTKLRAKQYTQLGPVAEIAELRISLRTSMRATREALDAAATEDASLSESLALFERLSTHGHDVDADLRRLEAEPDRSRIAARLPELRERTERVTRSADSLRWAIQDRAGRFAEDDLADLDSQIQMEAAALRHWRSERLAEDIDRAAEAATGTSTPFGSSGPTGPAGASAAGPSAAGVSAAGLSSERPGQGPGATAAASAGSEQEAGSGPHVTDGRAVDGGAEGADAPGPRALTAEDPRLRKTYPWQQAARPENTT
ncbi:hypothetical protein OYE22_23970 [Streptomyces sp. 71268]|uniref:hypothetical protein n=1 Tax=Streptomyces sp. 71268 TaxID=3002640 RepID=UPI0023F91539|nr:hypothetical protein [Streptomyces sp. 71268]WEV29944.1 hypothetical protein OYE22_23970 [Streptomyces sp. 71268]